MSFQLGLHQNDEAVFADYGDKFTHDRLEITDPLGNKLLELRDLIDNFKIQGSYNGEKVAENIVEIQEKINEIKEVLSEFSDKQIIEAADIQRIRSTLYILEGQVRQAELFLGVIAPKKEIDEVFKRRESQQVNPQEKIEVRIQAGAGFLAAGVIVMVGSAIFPLLGIFAFLPGVALAGVGGLLFTWGTVQLLLFRAKN